MRKILKSMKSKVYLIKYIDLLKQDIIFSLELPEKDHDNIFSFPS